MIFFKVIAFIFTAGIAYFCAMAQEDYPLSVLPTNSSKPIILPILGLLNNYYDPAEKPLWPIDSLNGKPVSRYDNGGSYKTGLSRRCALKALQSLFDVINNRENILPNYQLRVHYYDGDIADIFLAQIIADFISFQQFQGRFFAPIYFGPRWSACSTFYSIMPFLSTGRVRQFNQFPSFCSQQCNNTNFPASFESNHNKLVNGKTVTTFGLLGYIKATFKQVGIFADIQLSTAREAGGSDAAQLSKILEVNGVSVVHAEVGNDYVAMFRRLAEKRARIILVATEFERCEDCSRFWCSSHSAGITAPKFVLLLIGQACYTCLINRHYDFPADSLVDSCNASIQVQQLGIAIFSEQAFIAIGWRVKPVSSWVVSAWNNIFSGIEAHVDGCNLNTAVSIIIPALAAITTLNVTEHRLRQKYNLRLIEANRTFVSQVMAEVASEVSFANTPGAYDYLNIHQSVIFQLQDNTLKLQHNKTAFVLPFSGENLLYNLSAHQITHAAKPLWRTPTGDKPKDLFEIAHINASQNWLATAILICAAGFISFAQLVLSVYILKAFKQAGAQRQEFYTDRGNNLVILLGCLTLNISVLISMSGNEYYPKQVCYFRPLFVVIGLTTIDAMALCRSLSLPFYTHLNRYISQKEFRKRFQRKNFELMREKELAMQSRNITKGTAAFVSVSLIFLLVWFASDPMVLKFTVQYLDNPPFDEERDTYYDVRIEWCDSSSQIYWISALSCVHFLMLLIANIVPFPLKRKIRFTRKRFRPEIGFTRTLAVNLLIVMVFTALVMLVTPQKPATIAYLQITAFSSCVLLLSLSTSVIVFSNFLMPPIQQRITDNN